MMASVSGTLKLLLLLVLLQLSAYCGNSDVDVRLLSTPHAVSARDFATFRFQVLVNGQTSNDLNSAICKLDDESSSACNESAVYRQLPDGYHSFEVCTDGTQGAGCASYNWTVDTVPPTAYLTASTLLTRLSVIQINISFSEPCTGNGGFQCSSSQACNLLAYGYGQVMPNTLAVFEPNLEYSLNVNLSTTRRVGKVRLVMDKDFCTDSAGNMFTRTENSSIAIHFDRSSDKKIFANLSTHVPEKIVLIKNESRIVLATNKKSLMRICLYFSEPVLPPNEIMASLHISKGTLVPVDYGTYGMRRFRYWVKNISDHAVISVNLQSQQIITQWGPFPPVNPVTFLYDTTRPEVWFHHPRSKKIVGNESVTVVIGFMEPVFGFNKSCINITGGSVTSFDEADNMLYTIGVTANTSEYGGVVCISIPENITHDICGNPNSHSETLELKHYPLPPVFDALSTASTTAFAATALMTGFLTVSTASLQSAGAFTQASPPDPAKSIFRMAGHIQVYALSNWLAVDLPVEYSQFTKGLQWSIPYLKLPWEKHQMRVSSGPSMKLINDLGPPKAKDLMHDDVFTTIRGVKIPFPLLPGDYNESFNERKIKMPEEEVLRKKERWTEFTRSMFWLGIFYGSLVLLHIILYLLIWFRRENVKADNDRKPRPVILLRFEIFLLLLGVPSLCKASASLVKERRNPEIEVGLLLLAIVFSLLLALFLFLTIGILTRERLRYNEEPGQEHQFLVRFQKFVQAIFGQRKKGLWRPQNEQYSKYHDVLGPVFDELRGPPSQGNAQSQNDSYKKLFGTFRIYQAFLDAAKKVALGILAGLKLEEDRRHSRKSARAIIILSITVFQLLFMVMTNPFIARRMQFVEMFSTFCELGTFVACVVMLEGHISDRDDKKTYVIGIFMIALFILPFIAQLLNEWYGLFGQARELDPEQDPNHKKNFWSGLKAASVGFLLIFFPRRWIRKCIKDFDRIFPQKGDVVGESKGEGEVNTSQGHVEDIKGEASSVREIAEEPKISSQRDDDLASQGHTEDGEGKANTTTDSVKDAIPEEPEMMTSQQDPALASKGHVGDAKD